MLYVIQKRIVKAGQYVQLHAAHGRLLAIAARPVQRTNATRLTGVWYKVGEDGRLIREYY